MKTFKELNFQREYKSLGEKQLNTDFVVPALNSTSLYKRATAFFSSFVLETLLSGVEALYNNGGHMKLIMCPQISKEDKEVLIKAENYKKELKDYLVSRIKPELFELSDDYFELFYNLLITNTLEVKFALTGTKGIYHDKLAIFEDFEGNKMSFSGSANETKNAYEENYERVKIFKNFDSSVDFFNDDEKEFDDLWNDSNPELVVIDASEALKREVLFIVENNERTLKKGIKKDKTPRKYQQEAIDAWKANNNNGFFVMATGTGKTYTACFCIEDLFKTKNPIVIVAVPYIHLVAQWESSLKDVINADYFIEVYGANSSVWKIQLGHAIYRKKRDPSLRIVIISTIASWQSDYFQNLVMKFDFERLLVIDEAHRVSSSIDTVDKSKYQYSIGLSATPLKGRHLDNRLLSFFNGAVYNLPIEVALEKKFLCGYYYHPIYVETTENDERRFKEITRKMVQCFDAGGNIKPGSEDRLLQLVLSRTRLLSLTENKSDPLTILNCIAQAKFDDHFIIYCGDGHVSGGDERHLDYVKDIFNSKGYLMNRFTCAESMEERLSFIDLFTRRQFDGFVSIRCLDEGIDIPSIKSALILSSGDNYREFVQRRGRILRHFEGKEYADIYDIILLPSHECPGIAEIELRRFYEYARLSLNKDESLAKLKELVAEYGIEEDKVYNYFDSVDIDLDLEDTEDAK